MHIFDIKSIILKLWGKYYTLTFSDTFLKGFNSEEATLTATIQANQKVYDQMSDMIMDSWEKRNTSYDNQDL